MGAKHLSHLKRGARGRPSSHRQKKNPRIRGDDKSIFKSSRIGEQVDIRSKHSEEVSPTEDDLENSTSQLSSDEENIEVVRSPTEPYNVLLQSLGSGNHNRKPQQKKRKLSQAKNPNNLNMTVEDVDSIMDQEDPALDSDELMDLEDTDELREDQDPYVRRLDSMAETELNQSIEDVSKDKWLTVTTMIDSTWSYSLKAPNTNLSSRVKSVRGIEDLFLKQKLKLSATRLLPELDRFSCHIASTIFGYQDLLFPHRDLTNAEVFRKIVSLHSVNHIFKARDKIIKNNARIANEKTNGDIEIRDQGFTRAKVLIVLPTRQSCVRYVDLFIDIVEPEQQENKKRFQDSYMQRIENFSDNKPQDFKDLFSGNDDDMFRLGMKFTRKTVKFFTQFYDSDVILASPLGLRMALGGDKSKKDYDFLSSVEIVILDQSEALDMQNWEHIEYIFNHLNLQPKEAHNCDFSRVRSWYLENKARYLRQTILLSSFNFPSLNGIYNHHMLNISGKSKYRRPFEGAILHLNFQVKQTFSRFDTSSSATDPDDRFSFFTTAVLPSLTKHSRERSEGKGGVLIFLPSYTDFVRVRNYLATASSAQSISFASISEYASVKDVARARSHFATGRHAILLYTERAHHFRRYRLRGAKTIIMYGLPNNPLFYKEIVEAHSESNVAQMVGAGSVSVRSLYSKFDVLKLERIVGSKRYLSLLTESSSDTFDFL